MDAPSTVDMPDWRERVMAAVAESQAKRSGVIQRGRRTGQLILQFDREFNTALNLAAEARGITLAGYARRALARQIANDLDMDWTLLLSMCPAPLPYGSTSRPGTKHRTVDNGEGYGDWT